MPSNGKQAILTAKLLRQAEENALDAKALLYDSDIAD